MTLKTLKVKLFALVLSVAAFGSEATDNSRTLAVMVAQIKADSPVISGMMAGIRTMNITIGTLHGMDLATTELDRAVVTITVDVAKVLRNHYSLSATVIHEITHADDMVNALGLQTFINMEREDRPLPWAERRLERRAIQRTGIITAYLALQFPGKYTSSVPIVSR